jgi:hypothetical protein
LLLIFGLRTVSEASVGTVPAGTHLNVRTTQTISADYSSPGTKYRGIVDDPVDVNGRIVIPRGTAATLEVVHVKRSSNLKGRDRVTLKVLAVHIGRHTYPIATNYVELKGPSEGDRATRKILGGAGIGAVFGGIVGGGTGAAIGATAGGATGAVVAGSGKTHLSVPPETRLQFRLSGSVRIRP